MIILHSLWHQRRVYVWIYLEVVLMGIFLWAAGDFIYMSVANRMIPAGYEPDKAYVAVMDSYRSFQLKYRAEADNDTARSEAQQHIVRTIASHPDIEHFAVVKNSAVAGCGWATTTLYADSTEERRAESFIGSTCWNTYNVEGSDLIKTYGIELLPGTKTLPEGTLRALYISERVAIKAFGTTDVVGRELFSWRFEPCPVAGVFRNVKVWPVRQPAPLVFDAEGESNAKPLTNHYFVFRPREGADIGQLKGYLRQNLGIGNYYVKQISSLSELMESSNDMQKERRYIVLRSTLCTFAIACILLGLLGTFFVRANARRGDIAIMRALGASRFTVLRHFLGEALLLVSAAYALSLGIIAIVWSRLDGPIYDNRDFTSAELLAEFPQNNLWMHFTHQSLITFGVICLATVVAVTIPVVRALRTQLVEGLREEF